MLLCLCSNAQLSKTKEQVIAAHGQPDSISYLNVQGLKLPLLYYSEQMPCPTHGMYVAIKIYYIDNDNICTMIVITAPVKEKDEWAHFLNSQHNQTGDASWINAKGTVDISIMTIGNNIDIVYMKREVGSNNQQSALNAFPAQVYPSNTSPSIDQQMEDNREKFYSKVDQMHKDYNQEEQQRQDKFNDQQNKTLKILMDANAPKLILVPAHYDSYGNLVPSYYITP